MLRYALIFFIIALIAALLGFTGVAAGAAEIAKILFFVFLVIAAVSLVMGLLRRGPDTSRDGSDPTQGRSPTQPFHAGATLRRGTTDRRFP